MPRLPYSIELHDSVISELIQSEDFIAIQMKYTYIHNEGKGWSQKAEIVIRHPKERVVLTELPSRIDDGSLISAVGPYHNLLNLPLNIEGEIKLTLKLESGHIIFIEGQGISINLFGEAKYIEDFD